MTEKTFFSSNDGHIESIIIGVCQVKVSFQTWDGTQLVLIFNGAENVTSSNSVYCDMGEFYVREQADGLNRYIFEDAWGDSENHAPKICLEIEARELKIYEAGKSEDINSALFDVGTDFVGGQTETVK